jgi:isopentenyl-diphosphate Delta-isomerase
MDMTQVILVDENDSPVGTSEKMQAHIDGLLHRAFSVFIFNEKGEMLLQQRALNKYHSGGLWTNACCSHPALGEETKTAAVRRLEEEMGFETAIEKVFDFVYKADFENGLTEYEFDHVFVGQYDGVFKFNKKEVADACYRSIAEINQALQTHPENYTVWFHIAFPKVEEWWNKQMNGEVVGSH